MFHRQSTWCLRFAGFKYRAQSGLLTSIIDHLGAISKAFHMEAQHKCILLTCSFFSYSIFADLWGQADTVENSRGHSAKTCKPCTSILAGRIRLPSYSFCSQRALDQPVVVWDPDDVQAPHPACSSRMCEHVCISSLQWAVLRLQHTVMMEVLLM